MSVESRDITQASEILQDTMPATSTLNSGGENLTYANSPFTLAKIYRWLVGISKAIFGEKTRRNGAKRIQGLEQTLTGTITSSGTAVTGSGTLFQTELYVGAFIAGTANQYREVLSIASDTSLTLVSAFSVDIGSAQTVTRLQALAERVDGIEEYTNEVFNGDLNDWLASSFSSPASDTETANNWFVNYDGTIGTFAVSREAFTVGQTDVPGEPQYYYRWNHTSAGSAQTIKRIRHKISGVRSFAGQTIQVTFYAKFASAAAVTVGATQYFGSGGGPSADVSVTAKSRTLTTTFARYTVTLSIPSISGKTIGTSGDALYINFNLPLNATCDFQIANVSAYKGTAEIPFKVAVYTQRLKSALKTYFDTLYAPVASIMTAPTSVTPTFTGFGTVSAVNCRTWRVGAQLFFEITFTSGTATGTEARIGLRYNPGSGEVDVTTVSTYPTLAVVGSGGYNSGSSSWYPLAEASKTYICVGLDGAYNVLAKRDGNQIIGSGQIASLKGSVIINGW